MRIIILAVAFMAGCAAAPQQPKPVIPPLHTEQSAPTYRVPPTDDAASQAFLDQEIERKGRPPEPPPAPPIGGEMVYRDRYVVPQGYYEDPAAAFPWSTAYGASIGALIGYGSDHTGKGAAIGAGIGFLFDLGRWGGF